MSVQAGFSGVGCDTSRASNASGVYLTRCAYDEKHAGEADRLKAQALLSGVQAAQKDGFDLVAWSGPQPATLTSAVLSRGQLTHANVYDSFEYVVRGWKSAAGNAAPGAQPIAEALVELKGQVERLPATAASTSPAATESKFVWPVEGQVVSRFGADVDGKKNEGIDIRASKGSPVRAAAGGVVMYAGSGVVNMGPLLLIRHSGDFVTAYAYNDSLLVKTGDAVGKGQAIATVGLSPLTSDPRLHFEVRRGNKPIDPMTVLPPQ